MTKWKNFGSCAVVLLAGIFLLLFFVWAILKPSTDISESERRKLATRPELNLDTVLSGKFMNDYETYAADQFPLRDTFRRIKSLSAFYLFGQSDVNGVYESAGYLSKIEYPMRTDSLDHAAEVFRHVYDLYLKDSDAKIYLSIVPDKNYFLAEQNGYPYADYQKMCDYLQKQVDFMQPVQIAELLELSDYYRTDTHWRQEKITDVAQRLADEMGASLGGEYRENALDRPFYGVYCGQAALPVESETLYYLTSETLAQCRVFDYETDREIGVYDMEKAQGKDPYEIFLSGSKSLLKIENPNAKTDRRLILFRDSFGSSLAPLLAEGYAEIVIADIRYLPSDRLGKFVDFENCDVLFLYSTLVLNNSIELK